MPTIRAFNSRSRSGSKHSVTARSNPPQPELDPAPRATDTRAIRLRLSTDLPVIVEVVEEEGRIQELLPELDTMISGGLITLEKARVILYRPNDEEVPPAAT